MCVFMHLTLRAHSTGFGHVHECYTAITTGGVQLLIVRLLMSIINLFLFSILFSCAPLGLCCPLLLTLSRSFSPWVFNLTTLYNSSNCKVEKVEWCMDLKCLKYFAVTSNGPAHGINTGSFVMFSAFVLQICCDISIR